MPALPKPPKIAPVTDAELRALKLAVKAESARGAAAGAAEHWLEQLETERMLSESERVRAAEAEVYLCELVKQLQDQNDLLYAENSRLRREHILS